MFVLGFDFGVKYIGVALGQFVTMTASPIATIFVKNGDIDWNVVNELIDTWHPYYIVVGYPFKFEERNRFLCREIKKFIIKLECLYDRCIYVIDEDLSTWEASNLLHPSFKDMSRYYINLNAMSAVLLVNRFFFILNKH